MRWAARAALLVASVRASMTWEEAQCVVAGRRIAFFGDSLSRFCYFGFNTFLATGEVRDHEFDVSEGDGENSNDYDSFDTWNDNGLVSDGKNHRMHLRKDFAEYGAHTEYYFIQNVWYDDLDDTPLARLVQGAQRRELLLLRGPRGDVRLPPKMADRPRCTAGANKITTSI